MADVFLGSLMLVPYDFAPYGWAFCQGQLLAIQQYSALYSLLGIQYGGDGRTNFALPNLPGCLVVGAGTPPGMSVYQVGKSGGSPTVALVSNTVPSHGHAVAAASAPHGLNQATPVNNSFYNSTPNNLYAPAAAPYVNLIAGPNGALAPQGGGQAHTNMMPYVVLNWIIALTGYYPTRG
jgi:microcystin-dependent protein